MWYLWLSLGSLIGIVTLLFFQGVGENERFHNMIKPVNTNSSDMYKFFRIESVYSPYMTAKKVEYLLREFGNDDTIKVYEITYKGNQEKET